MKLIGKDRYSVYVYTMHSQYTYSMLDDGFKDELTEIVKNCPKSRQTMLFSATMTDNVSNIHFIGNS
jgi:hypothetical protein